MNGDYPQSPRLNLKIGDKVRVNLGAYIEWYENNVQPSLIEHGDNPVFEVKDIGEDGTPLLLNGSIGAPIPLQFVERI